MKGIVQKGFHKKPKPYATEGRAAYMIRVCISHYARIGRTVESIDLGRNLYQNLLDNINIAHEAKGEKVNFDEVAWGGTLIRKSLALDVNSLKEHLSKEVFVN